MFLKKKLIIFASVGLIVISASTLTTILLTQKDKQSDIKRKLELIKKIKTTDKKMGFVYKNAYYRPFQFQELKELGQGQPIMIDGIGYDAYTHGMSFLFNVMRELGFDFFANEIKLDEGKLLGIKYYNNYNQVKIKRDFPNQDPTLVYKELVRATSDSKTQIKTFRNNKRSSLDPAGVDGNIHKYWLKGGGIKSTEIFKKTTKIVEVKDENDSKKKIQKKIQYYKFVNSKIKQEFGIFKFWQMIDGRRSPTSKGNRIITGLEVSNYNEYKSDEVFRSLAVFGEFIQNKINKSTKWSFNYHFSSAPNFGPLFTTVSSAKFEEIETLMLAVIKNISFYLRNANYDFVSKITHPVVSRIFEFIKKLDLKNEDTIKQIKQAIEKLNNGSHNLLAIEIFCRGMKNIPMRYMPIPGFIVLSQLGGVSYPKEGVGEIVGMANSTDIAQTLLKMFHTTKKDYKDLAGVASKKDRESFDPTTTQALEKNKNLIAEQSIFGREIKSMGKIVNNEDYQKWWKKYQQWLKDSKTNPTLVAPTLVFQKKDFLI